MPNVEYVAFYITADTTPVPKGSTKSFVVGKRAITTGANPKTKPCQQVITAAAMNEVAERERDGGKPHDKGGAWELEIAFFMPRPKCHKKTVHHTTKPDVDKLCRTVLDALSGVLYEDDKQVCRLSAYKTYSGSRPSIMITCTRVA